MKIQILPQEDQTNGWSAIVPKRTPTPPLTGERRADWLVIGAGYAGLAAARRLAENDRNARIIVLDAVVVGEGAAGRNSGFAIDVPHNVGSSLEELRKADHYKRLLKSGMSSLEELVQRFDIDCQWSKKGKYHCAVSEKVAEQTIQHHAHELAQLGETYELLGHQELSRRLGTSYFHMGIYTPGGALCNPAALTQGLADSLPDNVELHESSPVVDIDYGRTIRAATPLGSIQADNVILTTNGFASQFGVLENKFFPLATFGSLTAPLSNEQRQRIGNVDEWGVTPANAITGATMRYTKDHRILIRQDFCYPDGFRVPGRSRENARRRHQYVFESRFPNLPDVKLEHFWMGTINMTRNGAPAWGKIGRNVYAAVGCNGVGIVKQTVSGTLIADLACGAENPLISDMVALGQPNRIPPPPFLGLGVKAFIAKERWVGRKEY